jgi:hypothetical protein
MNGAQHRDRISGFQDRSLVAGLKSPAWEAAKMTAQRLTAPMERPVAPRHHVEIGEMAVLGFEDGNIQQLRSDLGDPALQ